MIDSSSSRIPRAVLMAISLLLAAAILAAPAQAAWPGRSGPILYRGLERGPEGEGWGPAGLRQIDLGAFGTADQLSLDASDQDPQVSPDGRLVVFSRGIDPGPTGFPTASAIFVMHRDGTGLRQLTESRPDSDDIEPTFTASGKAVFFIRLGDETVRGTNQGDLYSIGLDGQGLRQITSAPAADRSPAASPNGRQVVFSRSGWRLPGGGRASFRHIFSIRPNGAHLQDLTPGLEPEAAASDPDFSPNGRVIAFGVGSRSASEIFTMRPSGARLRQLTGRHGHATIHGYGYAEPAFSPAGGELLAIAVNAYNTNLARIKLIDPDRPHRLAYAGDQPVWSPAPQG